MAKGGGVTETSNEARAQSALFVCGSVKQFVMDIENIGDKAPV